jgi:hypothetical protein
MGARRVRRSPGRPARPEAGVALRGASHFYVYYRIAADTPSARATIGTLLTEVEARTGVSGRLLARCDDPSTWMEVYAPVTRAAAFRRTVAALAGKLGAIALAEDGRRHVEQFAALRPPARRTRR